MFFQTSPSIGNCRPFIMVCSAIIKGYHTVIIPLLCQYTYQNTFLVRFNSGYRFFNWFDNFDSTKQTGFWVGILK